MKAEAMETIAASQAQLTSTDAQMMDDQAYLKELTEVCNSKSKEWDQRSKMRQDELTALTSALTVVKERVVTKTTEKTVRLLQGHAMVSQAAPPVDEAEEAEQPPQDEDQDADAEALAAAAEDEEASVSFLQLGSARRALVQLGEAKRSLRQVPAGEADA